MRLIFLVACLTACVEASVRAGAYQIMFFWNAYRIEVEVFGPGRTSTARNCDPNRACTFDEFIKHIEMTRNRPGFQGTTGVPANARELPTIQTAEHLKAIGYSSNFDPMKLYPEVYAVDEETIKKTIANAPSLKEILGNTASKLQEARTRATGLDNLLALATESLEVCADMRKADLADSLIENLKDDAFYKNGNFNLHLLDPKSTLPNGGVFDEINIHATINDAENQRINGADGMKAFEEFLVKFINGHPDMKGKPKNHTIALKAVQSVIELLSFPVGSVC